jgi:hypothetical protein
MKSPSDRRHLPAWIGGKDDEANDADHRNDQCTSDTPPALDPPGTRKEQQRHGEDRANPKVKEPSGLADGVL